MSPDIGNKMFEICSEIIFKIKSEMLEVVLFITAKLQLNPSLNWLVLLPGT